MTTLENKAQLPQGYDNPDSQFYVKPELRDYYLEAKPQRINSQMQNRTQSLILTTAREQAEQRFPRGQELDMIRNVQATVEELKATRWGDYALLAQHQLRLEEANSADRQARFAAVKKQLAEEAARCPVCGDTGQAEQGETKPRILATGGTPNYKERLPVIRSCVPCWVVAANQYQQRIAGTKFGKHSRRELVEKALNSL